MAMMAAFPVAAFLLVRAPEKPWRAAEAHGLRLAVPERAAGSPAAVSGTVSAGAAFQPGDLPEQPPEPLPPRRARDSWLAAASRAVEPAVPWIALGWMAGVLVLSVRQAGGWVGARRLTRRGTCAAAAELADAVARLAARLRVTRPVRLLESALVRVPTMIGWLRPVILTPVGFAAGLPVEQVEALLAHELAHIRRRDYLVNLLQSLVETLLFYHPAVWLVSRRVRVERENCCDDLVVACGGERMAYAEALAGAAARAVGGRPRLAAAALGAAGGPSELRRRIARLLGQGADARARLGRAWPLAVALILALAATSYVSCRSPEGPAPGADAAKDGAALAPQPGWSEWDALRLDLEVLAVPGGDLQRTQLKLTATNTRPNDLVLDRELVAGFDLSFLTGLEDPVFYREGRNVSCEVVEKLPKPRPEEAATRFVSLKPGQSLSRVLDLSKPIQCVEQGHASDYEHRHAGHYSESMIRFTVPSAAKELRVEVWYKRGLRLMAATQFAEWHGRGFGDLSLWVGRARSNAVVIQGRGSGLAPGTRRRQEAKELSQPIVQLWDGGNVFIQPRMTLILALWADGKVVSRVDEKGRCKLHFAIPVDLPGTKLMVGRIDPKRLSGIMSAISRAGFFETDEHSGFVRPDGANVFLFARDAARTNEIHHEAVDDTKTHAEMKTPEARQFGKMWDSVMDTLRAIQPRDWRPVRPEDKVVTEIPWKQSGNK
ncbi:MAG: M56 family metallopeptidase [Planctomycetes bacterium]|nr:M56 family metallopeptidase [Planctomycetota bacterium]